MFYIEICLFRIRNDYELRILKTLLKISRYIEINVRLTQLIFRHFKHRLILVMFSFNFKQCSEDYHHLFAFGIDLT
jgi:hypothetical protein